VSPDVRICGTLVPNGKGEITKDGVVVSGEWGFNSGAWHSEWKFPQHDGAQPGR